MKTMRAVWLLAGLALVGMLAVGSGTVAAQAAPADPSKSGKIGASLIGKLEGPEIVRDAKKFPKTFKEAPMLAELVKAGKLPPVEKRLPDHAPDGRQAAPRDRQVRRHVAARLHRARRRRERQPHRPTDKILFWDYTGTKIDALPRQGLGASATTARAYDDLPAQGHEVVRRRSRSPPTTSSSGTRTSTRTRTSCRRRCPSSRSTASRDACVKVDDDTVVFEFPEPYFLFVDILAGEHRHRRRATRRAGGVPEFRGAYAPAHYLKQFLPKYSLEEEVEREGQGRGLRRLGEHCSASGRLGAQPRPAGPGAVEDGAPHQHADLGCWSAIRTTGRGHRGQPAALHRPDHHDAGGEPRGRQPARHRRRVRPAGAAHRPGEAAGVPRERQARATTRSTSIRPSTARDVALPSATSATRPIPRSPSGSDHGTSAAPCRWASTATSSTRPSGWASARRARWRRAESVPSTARAPSGARSGRVLDVKQANELLDKIGLTQEGRRGLPPAHRRQGAAADRAGHHRRRSSSPITQIAEMIKQQWKKIGIEARRQGDSSGASPSPATASNEHQIDHLGQRRFGNALPVPAPCAAGRPGRSAPGHALCPLVRQRARRARSPSDPEDAAALELFRAAAARRTQSASRSRRRSGRSWSTAVRASARSVCRRRSWACAS